MMALSTKGIYKKSINKRLSDAELAFLIALASWVMLFGAFILSFVLARIKTPLWPPPYIASFPILLPTLSTISVFLSSVLIHKGFTSWGENKKGDFQFFWGMGILLGIFFALLQFFALSTWIEGVEDFRTHVYSSSVAFLIVFHGLHFFVGIGGLVYQYFLKSKGQALKLWSWFWHFLGVIWLAIFLAIAL
jgi:heme/copper-type cytochrome/quinol oxidase subunit 3